MVQYLHSRVYTSEHSCQAQDMYIFSFTAVLFSKVGYQFPFPLVLSAGSYCSTSSSALDIASFLIFDNLGGV